MDESIAKQTNYKVQHLLYNLDSVIQWTMERRIYDIPSGWDI